MSFFQGSAQVLSLSGTGAALNVELGYTPRYVKVVNATTLVQHEWFDDMADGTSVATAATGARTLNGANGISKYPGVAGSNSRGVTIGTAAGASGDVLRVLIVGGND